MFEDDRKATLLAEVVVDDFAIFDIHPLATLVDMGFLDM